ncbi:MAG: tRNA pseudouridine(13) synthase TruD [Candidatus Heimdallarchaeota archaeon]
MAGSSIESLIGIRGFSTPTIIGMGGVIRQHFSDFIVREILPNGSPIFDGSKIGFGAIGGLYVHCLLQKSGLDTFTAIRKISNCLKVSERDFGYAGLKDAEAVTYQRISIWNIAIDRMMAIDLPQIRLFNPVRQRFAVKIGDLAGNHFEITIRKIQRNWNSLMWDGFIRSISSRGILNYFMAQRFGSRRPILHLIGRFLIQKRYAEVISAYLGYTSLLENPRITELRKKWLQNRKEGEEIRDKFMFPNSYHIENIMLRGLKRRLPARIIIENLPHPFLRLAISAYQSYLYNLVLSYLNKSNIVAKNTLIPLVGYQSPRHKHSFSELVWNTMNEILEDEAVEFDCFRQIELPWLRSKGSKRKAVVYPTDFKRFKLTGSAIKVTFSLPKGSYGTAVMRELLKTQSDLEMGHSG